MSVGKNWSGRVEVADVSVTITTVIALAALLLSGCRSASVSPPPHTLLWVPSDGVISEGPQTYKDGSATVSVTVTDTDPDALTSRLLAHYSGGAWTLRLKDSAASGARPDWIRPPTGILALDAQGKRIDREVRYWQAYWENQHGDFINYLLQETRTIGTPGNEIRILGSYMPGTVRRDFRPPV